jgi:hypothetical protein
MLLAIAALVEITLEEPFVRVRLMGGFPATG